MACEVCEHCQGPFTTKETTARRDGYSYHTRCHKCYVCSETNLRNAEVFKGVIFCSGCSKRIFQGCSTARRNKDSGGRKRVRSLSRKIRDQRRSQKRKRELNSGIIELTRLADCTDSDSRNSSEEIEKNIKRNTLGVSTEMAALVDNKMCHNTHDTIKKRSVEMGVTTMVTQELLKQMNCPVVMECRHNVVSPSKPHKTKLKQKNNICSDMRIAELGASTEIANMALRKKSELPVIIKSNVRLMQEESYSLSILNQDSDISGDSKESGESGYTLPKESFIRHLMDRRIGSLVKLPYKSFKKNILNRSPLVSAAIDSGHERSGVKKRIRRIFYEEISDHHRHGIRRLYSTINRRRNPYKLGWLELVARASGVTRSNDDICKWKRCKHAMNSESYRCLRSHVMRLAGPTKNELARFRSKVRNVIAPTFLTNILTFNNKYAIKMSRACGSDIHDAGQQPFPVNTDIKLIN